MKSQFFLSIMNQGGYSYPHSDLSAWGLELLSIIRTECRVANLNADSISNLRGIIHKQRSQQLTELFTEAYKSIINIDHLTDLEAKIMKHIQEKLTSKVLHARFNMYLKSWKDQTTSRFSNSNKSLMKNIFTLRDNMKAVTFYKSASKKRKITDSNTTSNPTTGSFDNINSSISVLCDVANCELPSIRRCRTANCSKYMCKIHWPQKGGHPEHIKAGLQFKPINSVSGSSNNNI